MRDLQRRATDSLIEQVLRQFEDAVVLGPGSRLGVLHERYEGRLIDLLHAAFPDTPESVFHRVRPDLVVVSRDLTPPPSGVVRFSDSVLRVPKGKASAAVLREWQEAYALTNVTLRRTRYLDSDLHDCRLRFDKTLFVPRSFEAWARLSLGWARQCAAMLELKRLTGLKQKELIFSDGRDSSLVPATLYKRARRDGESVEIDLEDCV